MTPNHKLYPDAERMFVQENKSPAEIEKALGIPQSTLSGWRQKQGWNKQRKDWQQSGHHIAARLKVLLAQELRDLDKLDNASVDRIMKAVKSIKSLNEDADILASTIKVMEQFGVFLSMKKSKFEKAYRALLPEFLVYMREKYKS